MTSEPSNEVRAVEWIELLGGSMIRDHSRPDQPIVALDLSDSRLSDEGLTEPYGGHGCRFERAGRVEWTHMPFARGNRVIDDGVLALAALPHLVALNLKFIEWTDAGLGNWMAFEKLTTLDLRCTLVTDAGVEQLGRRLPNCEVSFR